MQNRTEGSGEQLNELKPNKAAGADGMTGEKIRTYMEQLATMPRRIYDRSGSDLKIHGQWTRGVTVSL